MYILYHLCGEAGLMLTNKRVIHVRDFGMMNAIVLCL